jgi:hypothetical protein
MARRLLMSLLFSISCSFRTPEMSFCTIRGLKSLLLPFLLSEPHNLMNNTGFR